MELNGGTSSLYKKGNIVYRKQRENSETVHRLLKHLKNKGFDKAPEFLGIDGEFEMLSFVDGECFEPEEYPFTNDENKRLEIIRKSAKILRKYHDLTADFEVKETDKWWLTYNGKMPEEVICHNDFATYNVTFVDGLPYGMIDFDTCTPAPRIWDIAYAVYRFVPLSELQFDADLRAERKYNENDKEFPKAVKDLEKNLRIQRNKPVRYPMLGLMGVERSRNTGLPVCKIVGDKHLDAATYAKRCSVGNTVGKLCVKAFGEESVKAKKLPYEISDLTGSNDWIAVIHADGNGLGQIVQKIGTDAGTRPLKNIKYFLFFTNYYMHFSHKSQQLFAKIHSLTSKCHFSQNTLYVLNTLHL